MRERGEEQLTEGIETLRPSGMDSQPCEGIETLRPSQVDNETGATISPEPVLRTGGSGAIPAPASLAMEAEVDEASSLYTSKEGRSGVVTNRCGRDRNRNTRETGPVIRSVEVVWESSRPNPRTREENATSGLEESPSPVAEGNDAMSVSSTDDGGATGGREA